MTKRTILITAIDYAKLRSIIEAGTLFGRSREELRALRAELDRAEIVRPDEVPSDVITINSVAELLDLDTGESMEFTLVLPARANIDDGKISVLAPLGTAMLGHAVGDEFEWTVPYGVRRLKVIHVTFQPETAFRLAA